VTLLTTTAIATAGVASAAPKGFRTIQVDDAGFSIAVPKSWATVDLTAENAEELLETARETSDALGAQLSGNVSDYRSQNVVLLGADKKAEAFVTNLNVINVQDVTDAPTVDDVASQVESLAPDAEVGETTVDGEPAIRAQYELSRGNISASLTQIALSGPNGALVITFTASQDDPQTSRISKMIKSLKLLD
jgi:hypothetical protein